MPLRKLILLPLMGALLLLPSQAGAAVTCPNASPVVNENNCMGAGSSAWQLTDYNQSGITGYAAETSVDLGQSVHLRIALPDGEGHADVTVFRMGWYGGAGGRLVYQAKNVAVDNSRSCNEPDFTTGYWDCSNWDDSMTVPGSALPASGVYLVRIRDTASGNDNQIVFTVRNDKRHSDLLYKLPIASYQAYNYFNGHSLYTFNSAGFDTITGVPRAVKVSFDRPFTNTYNDGNWLLKADLPMIEWLEREGYDVDYTDNPSIDANPKQLLDHKTLVISGHDEYWSGGEMAAYKAARDAGVNIASFSGNTAFWKVRYEDGGRTLVCYKSVEGLGPSTEGGKVDGSAGVNDWGPDGLKGTADDALGKDGIAGTSDDKPQNATTTFRDNGAAPGNPNAPAVGRVGPDEPENSLLGSMFIGGNANFDYPMTVPATNAQSEFAGDRIWRNSGVAETSTTSIGSNLNGWEWDTIPTQPQYTSRQPAGVKRLTSSNVGTAPSPPDFLQDEGLMYANVPPPGQPSTVSAVKYTAPSGALVFAAGTIQWSWGLEPHYLDRAGFENYEDPPVDSSDPRIQQATYNVFSDMDVQPQTPAGIVIDGNDPPSASFTATPNPVSTGTPVSFDASGSTDADGSIVKYEWDLDGNGTYETNTGATPTAAETYGSAGERTIRLRVTDNGGASHQATRTLVVSNGAPGNLSPQASFTATPNPVPVETQVSFNASGSSDPDGSVVKYEWDLDGNGSFETNTGATATVTHSYAAEGDYQIGLRATDDDGASDQTTRSLIVGKGGTYHSRVLATTGLTHYWRLGEKSGTTFADSVGTSPATTLNGVTLGTAGLLTSEDGDLAASFDGTDDTATAAVNLSSTSKLTVEFWLNWSAYANDDDLAFEFTPDFNTHAGGFLIDPNAGEEGGKFAVGIGLGSSRNNVYFNRPSAGAWHHYAFVIDSGAPAAQQILPYVDGQAVPFVKRESGTGAGSFASSTLYFMSRGASALFGKGSLDEVSLYDQTLSAATIAQQFNPNPSQAPTASFTAAPNPVPTGTQVNFNASASSDPDGSVVKYEWDLDGNGSYETSTGATPTTSKTYASEGALTIGLRVTDDSGATGATTRIVTVQNHGPQASFTASPNPVPVGGTVNFDASGSSDPDGSIAKYEWDLDGNGSFETDTGTTPTTSHTYENPGDLEVGLRITDNKGATATTTRTVSTVGSYGAAVSATPGLVDYWRLGDKSGPTLTDSVGGHNATAQGGVTLGAPGALSPDTNAAASFDGNDDAASAALDLSGTSKLTVEFWLNWSAYANDDDLAFEFTPNFNNFSGGFLVDPNAGEEGGKFAVGIGRGSSRNNAYFARPSAGTWHHYAFVLDGEAPASQQVLPYVDGVPVSFTKLASGTGAGNFASSTLYFMSRNASALFGNGSLDEVALYNRALSGAEIATHYKARGVNQSPKASFNVSPNPVSTGATVSFDASASSDPDGTIAKYEWDLDGNGSYETDTGTTASTTKTYATAGERTIGLRVTDDSGTAATTTRVLTVDNSLPQASFTATPNPVSTGAVANFDASGSADPDGSIVKYEWDLDGNGTYETNTGATASTTKTYATAGERTVGLRVTDDSGSAATTTRVLTVEKAVEPYSATVTATPGLIDYWRLGETSGTTFADSVGGHNATAQGGVTLGAPGPLGPKANAAASFDGASGGASAPLELSGTSKLTVEFWLNWAAYANDDDLALEFTQSFNNVNGGFLIDPSAGEQGGQFAVGIGRGPSRNNAYFPRPSAGAWHHYAFVLDSEAPAAEQIIPYVDGVPVEYSKLASGTGAGAFTNSTLYFMSRGASALFGNGSLDELALYNRALSGAEIAAHFDSSIDKPPVASFTAPAAPVLAGTPINFDASASTDPDGTIDRYEWDLDGNGSYETDTGATATTTKTYATAGERTIGLRVTDDRGETSTTSRAVTVHGNLPTASFTATPNPVPTGTQVSFDASGSSDPDGSLAKYEWDLDGNGSYETDTGTTASATKTYAAAGNITAGLRVTDGDGTTATSTAGVTVQNRAPTASFTATPNPVPTGTQVSFDASGSSDPDGTVTKYEWDLDGNGSFETDTGTTASATSSFANSSDHEVGLRVTDGEGATATTSRIVTVQNRVPVASFTATPNPVPTGTQVSFDASDSSDPDGTVTKYEWDLDGNGSYETDTGVSATASETYAVAGNVTVGLRITDDEGAAATTTKALTVQNRAPVASFTATPNPVPTGTAVSFDASASSDPDGTVAKYEWDLDGNGSYETNTGSTASASKTYASASNVTVGLRVTDDGGSTAATTVGLTVQNRLPTASFTATPNPVVSGNSVSFNGSGSSDPDGTVTKYEWDLDGNGSYETNTGATATTTKVFATAGNLTVALRITDNNGGTATTTRSLTVSNRAPTASFTATPNPVPTGTAVSFNGAASSDPDGTVAKYEWDLDGNGSYETDTGATATTTKTYATAASVTVGLRVTDNIGATATTTKALTVQNRAPTASFTATPNPVPTGTAVGFDASASSDPDGTVTKYEWDLDGNGSYETNTGATATTTKTYASASTPTIGLRITDNNSATATTTRVLTVQNRLPTASFTATPNPVVSGNSVSFNGSGSTDPDGTISKYEWDFDGNGSYETSTGATATTTKVFATAGNVTVGLRVTDNSGGTATTTKALTVSNRAPTASFTATPNPVPTGTAVSFNGAGSTDPDGTLAKYEWDLDGNGSYETDTGATATTTKTYATAGSVTVGLRVTDNIGATATTTKALTVQNRAPTASFTATPNPVTVNTSASFNGSASSDPDGTVTKYEWDLDANGSYETNTGATATTTKTFTTAGDRTIGLRVTDNAGATGTTTVVLKVQSPYSGVVSSTSGLIDYWRMAETSGTSFADSVGGHTATAANGVTLGAAGALANGNDSNPSASFDGSNDAASAALNLSGTSKLTVEFWLKWSSFSNNDDLAFEFTPNSSNTNGGFFIDPNSSELLLSRFGVGIGRSTSRNTAYFSRPSANVWHHYAIVFDSTAAASQQVIPYVDGQAVSYLKLNSGTGAGAFANSTLYFMSRSASSLFGQGSLDEVALYNRALSAAEIAAHYKARE
jgi:YD repeat-containing protein